IEGVRLPSGLLRGLSAFLLDRVNVIVQLNSGCLRGFPGVVYRRRDRLAEDRHFPQPQLSQPPLAAVPIDPRTTTHGGYPQVEPLCPAVTHVSDARLACRSQSWAVGQQLPDPRDVQTLSHNPYSNTYYRALPYAAPCSDTMGL